MYNRLIHKFNLLVKTLGASGFANASLRTIPSFQHFGNGSQKVYCENRKPPSNVVQKWVASIFSSSSSSSSASESSLEGGFLKRPTGSSETLDKLSLEKQSYYSSSLSNTTERLRLRRRLSNNMWTSVPLDDKLIWVDCEMTGLNPDKDYLMEIGIKITGPNLEEIACHDSVIFHIEEPVLQGMDSWCQKHHGDSGLTEAARKSTITHAAADEQLLAFLQKYTKAGECPIAGNSIGQDRLFLRTQLPKFYAHLHYRSVDVSTIKELVRRWYPGIYNKAPKKKYSHRVLDDIQDSIDELEFYRSMIFRDPAEAEAAVAVKQAESKSSKTSTAV